MPHHRTFIEAAAAAGVAHVVYLSFVAAGPDAIFLHARSHGETERMLADAGLSLHRDPQLDVRRRHPGLVRRRGLNTVPGGDGRMSFSYRPELARAIAVTLTEPGHEGKVYDIVTPQSVSMRELAEIAWAVSGANYRYAPTSDAAVGGALAGARQGGVGDRGRPHVLRGPARRRARRRQRRLPRADGRGPAVGLGHRRPSWPTACRCTRERRRGARGAQLPRAARRRARPAGWSRGGCWRGCRWA